MCNTKIKFLLFIILPSFLINSCSNPAGPDLMAYEIANPPVITGIVVTGADTPFSLKTIGNPNERPYVIVNNIKYNVSGLYPNPASTAVSFFIYVPKSIKISIWVIKGISANESLNNYTNYENAQFYTSKEHFAINIAEGVKQTGAYREIWDCKDQYGNRVEDGFYRIFINVDGQLMWRDLWVFKNAGQEGYY